MIFLTTLLVSTVITITVMPYSRELAIRLQAIDKPGPRKVHDHLVPKCGGLAMAIGAMMPILLWAPKTTEIKGLLIGSLVIVVFGLADDIKDLKPTTKLMGQIMAALLVILVGEVKIINLGSFLPAGILLPDLAAVPLTVLVIVGVTNATNLADGLDGLAGGLSLMIFICLAYLAIIEGYWPLAMIAIALGGSIFGFLRFNSYPAQLFMGDAGSQMLGFVAIVLAITLTQQSASFSAALPLIIFGIPVLDTLTVMTRRLAKRQSPFQADRRHFHHRLIGIGLFHTEAVFVLYLTQALLVLLAIAAHGANDWLLLAVYLVFAAALLGTLRYFQKTGYQVAREGWLNSLKNRLWPLKDRGLIIRYSFRWLKIGVLGLLIFNGLFPLPGGDIIIYFAGGLLFLLLTTWFFCGQHLNRLSKVVLYLCTPFFIFNVDQVLYTHFGNTFLLAYNASFVLLLALLIMTLKFTRRTQGFKPSTLDFLVVFIIILIPNLPDTGFTSQLLGLVAIKTVILYYGYEVVIGELRGEALRFTVSTAAAVVGLNGLVTAIARYWV